MIDDEAHGKKGNSVRNFLRACQSGNLSRVETLVSKYDISDWTIFRHEVSGDTPLHLAARAGHLNIVRYLCEMFEKPEFKVDVANKDMKRPLHDAAQFANSRVVKYLIDQGASVDALKRADWTPLMLACTKTGPEACECITELLEAKANPFLSNKDGWTPLLLICRSGDETALNLILNHSIKCIEVQSNNGRSPMHVAAFHGHERIIASLATANPNCIRARDSSGSTPLHEAIKGGHLSAAKLLIQLGADVGAKDNVGHTILHTAALTGNIDATQYILQKDLIDVHARALFDMTPLIAARRGKRAEVIELLLEYGAKE